MDIESHLPKMNEIRQKSYEKAIMKPKKVDKNGKITDPMLKLFEMPIQRNHLLDMSFVEALI